MYRKLKLLFYLMKGNKLKYLGAILAVAFSTGISLLPPLVIRSTIDSIIGDQSLQAPVWLLTVVENIGGRGMLRQNLWVCGIILVILTLVNGIFQFARGRWCAEASETIARNIRERLYDQLQNLSYDYHVKAQTGDLIQRCTSDVETIRRFLAMQFVEIGRAVFTLVFALFVMLSLNVSMTMVSMIVVPFILVLSTVFFIRIKKRFKMSDEAEGRMSTTIQENLTGVRVVRAFGRQAYEVEKFDNKNREFRDLTYRLITLLAGYWSFSDFLIMAQVGAVLILGVYWASANVISIGTLVVFISYEGMLLWPIRQMGRILADMGKCIVSLNRINEILGEKREHEEENTVKPEIKGNIEFKNVYFGYGEGKEVLRNISFKVNQGQTVAILGPTGSGKSSLMHILQRLYDYAGGSVTIDGIELRSINKKWLRKNIGIVLQEPFLYSKTIKENIGIAKENVKDVEIFEAARTAAVHDSIEEFEEGYDTPVGERGVTLSGGQKQRVAMARTLIRECPVIIFDDSLSAVDTETDAQIRNALKERNNKATTFIISHRITTLAEADIILVLEHGELMQAGTHQDLIERPGLYRKIWSIQSSEGQESEDYGDNYEDVAAAREVSASRE